ncbi:MAG: hypothetical protein IT247_02115, partial [Bacteroidia bacterium]|nr:hypothetical protein [Bacteroidia bacterium]
MNKQMSLNKINCFLIITFLLLPFSGAIAQDYRRWKIIDDGSISWMINNSNIPHGDHIEMSGKRISCVLRYGVAANGSFYVTKSLVWPMLRTIPNNTHASLIRQFRQDGFDFVTVNYKPVINEKVSMVTLNGTVLVRSKAGEELELTRQYFPSPARPEFCEIYTIKNISKKNLVVEIPQLNETYTTNPARGTDGSYTIHASIVNSGHYDIHANDSISFAVCYSGTKQNEGLPVVNCEEEKQRRLLFVQQMWSNLVLETPDTVLNKAFAYAKIRAGESIYETKG